MTDEYDEAIVRQLSAIREGGYCNMFDVTCVRDAADQIGFNRLVRFIDEADNETYMAHLQEMGRRRSP